MSTENPLPNTNLNNPHIQLNTPDVLNIHRNNSKTDSIRLAPEVPKKIRAAGSSLGTSAESSSHAKKHGDQSVRDALIKARYRWQRRARALLPDEQDRAFGQCSRVPLPEQRFVVGRYNPDNESSTFAGLVHCDSYACPICAFRRSEEDRHRLSIALAQMEKMNLFPLLITLTLRHHISDTLDELRVALAKAYDATFSGRWYKSLCEEYGIKGKVKAWECTYGPNGFHPHLHLLAAMESELSGRFLKTPEGVVNSFEPSFEDRIKERWIGQLAKLGFDASWTHGVDVRSAQSDIAEYIAKWGREPQEMTWGADAELAKAPVKKSHADGLTPFELLAASAGDSEALARFGEIYPDDDRQALITRSGALYREYFHAFKGKPRLYWGSLKKVLNLNQALKDYAAANPVERKTVDMVLIDAGAAWYKLLRVPDGLGELRAVIRTGDAFKVLKWLSDHQIDAIVSPDAFEASARGSPD